jgi:hypothetical protein
MALTEFRHCGFPPEQNQRSPPPSQRERVLSRLTFWLRGLMRAEVLPPYWQRSDTSISVPQIGHLVLAFSLERDLGHIR